MKRRTYWRWTYWIEGALKLFVYIFIASIIYGLFMSTIDDDGFSIKNWITTSLCYGILMWLILISMINISKITVMANIALSMGETRKNALLGINICNLTGICVTTIAALTLCLVSHGEYISLFNTFITIPCLQFFASGVGLCINSMNKNSSLALNGIQTFFMFLDIIFISVITIFSVMCIKEEIYVNDSLALAIIIVTAVLGLILYIIGNIRMQKKIYTLEVSL